MSPGNPWLQTKKDASFLGEGSLGIFEIRFLGKEKNVSLSRKTRDWTYARIPCIIRTGAQAKGYIGQIAVVDSCLAALIKVQGVERPASLTGKKTATELGRAKLEREGCLRNSNIDRRF